LPEEGRWQTVLLADQNLGIAGDPDRLLRRVFELLEPGGMLLLEVAPVEVDEVVPVCLSHEGSDSEIFVWAHVGPTAAAARAEKAGFSINESWSSQGRRFLSFTR
jgi:hypothetical protein